MFGKNHVLCCLICAVMFLHSNTALAKVTVFGPSLAYFSLDVPDGWTSSPTADGVTLRSPNGTSHIEITVTKNAGETTAEVTSRLAQQQAGASKPTVNKDGSQSFSVTSGTSTTTTTVEAVRGIRTLTMTATGADTAPILSSLCWLREYGTKKHRYVLQVPFGWTEQMQNGGIQLTPPDNSGTMALLSFSNPKRKTLEDFAKRVSGRLHGTQPVQDFGSTLSFDIPLKNGKKEKAICSGDKSRFFLTVLAGEISQFTPVLHSRVDIVAPRENQGLKLIFHINPDEEELAPCVPQTIPAQYQH